LFKIHGKRSNLAASMDHSGRTTLARRNPQYFLADLVAIVALGGLAMALVRSIDRPASVIGISLLLGLVVLAWKWFRMKREAPACAECGRRSVTRIQKTSIPSCPQCGQPQVGTGRTREFLAISSRAFLALLLLAVILVRFLQSDLARFPLPSKSWIALPLTMMVLLTLFYVRKLARSVADSDQLKSVPCENCGCIIPPFSSTTPLICARCRLRRLPEKQLRKQQAKGFGIMLALLMILGLFAGFMVPVFAGSHFGITYWLAVPLVVVATLVGLPAVLFVVLVSLTLIRGSRMRGEAFILASARKAAGDDGEVLRPAQATVWYSGPTNPVPQLIQQMEATRTRLESLITRELVSQPPPRILCFEKRSAFQKFLQPSFAHLSTWLKTLDGIYLVPPHRILALCTEDVPGRVVDRDKTTHALFCSYFMSETSPDNRPAPWLQRGISKTLVSDPDDRARLNRKMLVSLSRGTSLATDLFKLNDAELVKLIKGWSDHRNFARLEQFSAESWSVFEYLGGTQATAERQDGFRAFLNENHSKGESESEETFKRHFGFGFDQLFERWRAWVQEQGIGTFAPLSPLIQDGLLNRVIPLVEDSQAKREDRILAIRNMGIEGYVLGADALIGLLQVDDAIPREEVVWALEAISGMAYGDDKDRWATWRSDLPAEIGGELCGLEDKTREERVAPERSSFSTVGEN
jgi:hypothetical protein